MFRRVAIIGCGLMGGSFALALRQGSLAHQIVGFSKSATSTEKALALGVVDTVMSSSAAAAREADLVLVAVPVTATEPTLREIAPHLSEGALLMDVGSTKEDVVQGARRALGERIRHFVPAHPIAGKETGGVEYADAALYQGRDVILTPTPETDPALLGRAVEVWRAVGSRVRQMSPRAHDKAYAAVSHLPHLLAFAYFNAVAAQEGGDELLSLAGPGFRDFTRIAGSQPEVWRDILLSNGPQVLAQLALFRARLEELERAVKAADPLALERLVREASEGRRRWPQAQGDVSPSPAP